MKKFFEFVLIVIACVIIFSLIFLLPACTTTRHIKSTTKDSTVITKVDSGRVAINTNTKTDSLAWWREIVNFLPKGRDTTINNFTTMTPVNNYYPAQIIREGGTQKSQSIQINYDSLWNNRLDSLTVLFSERSKDTKTTVLGFWQILAIAGGVGLIFFLIGKLKIGLK